MGIRRERPWRKRGGGAVTTLCEIRERGMENITLKTRLTRLSWYGHILRIDEGN